MKRLRRLDASVTQTAEIVALVLGVIGALVLGFGMSLCMTKLGNLLRMKSGFSMILGIVASIFGGALASLAYPAYNAIERARRRKLAPEIIRLADELMK
jgi:ABC-type antimicrobial peptide transport system permease subunit